MAKTRIVANDEEQQLVARARELSRLQARRRHEALKLAELDEQIQTVKDELGDMVGASKGAALIP